MELTNDPTQQRRFVETLHDGLEGRIRVLGIETPCFMTAGGYASRARERRLQPKPTTRWCETVDQVVEAVGQLAELEHTNVYVCPSRYRPDGNGSKANVAQVRCVWVDLDDVDPERELELVELQVPPPSMVVATSDRGLQCFWLLDEPLDLTDTDNVARLEAINRGLVHALRGDRAATDAGRPLRVPGTTNWPSAEKVANGRKVSPARLLRVA